MPLRRLPASPPAGPWPAEMRAPTAAAFLDYADTGELFGAVSRGEAPRPTAQRGRKREPVWARAVCESWVAQRHNFDVAPSGAVFAPGNDDDVASLI
ncbi:MAG: hypothetical protein K0R27_3206 [Xanthobacteraceae bacterium]|jgi:hypothetical protein|nr:hypothetical protein [Xanthobacteraceae bacterium]